MRSAPAALFLLVVGGVARADDPPAKPPHENKVTPEAQAAIDAFKKSVYRVSEHGVSSAKGVVVAVGLPSVVRAPFTYEDGRFESESPRGFTQAKTAAGFPGSLVHYPLGTAFEAADMLDHWEMDAEVVVRGGARVLVVTEFDEGTLGRVREYELDAGGLVTRSGTRDASPDDDCPTRFTWAAVGGQRCIESIEYEGEGRNCLFRLRCQDVEGARLVVGYEATFGAPTSPKTVTCHVADLVVNGKKIDLPTPWKHAGVATPEARAAVERFQSLRDRPAEHGVRSVSALLAEEGSAAAPLWRFGFTVPGHVRVSPAEGAKPTQAQERESFLRLEMPLVVAYEGVPLSIGDEDDAAIVEERGVRRVVVTNWRDGVQGVVDEFELDAEGLVARMVRRRAGVVELALALRWRQAGARRVVEAEEATFGGANGRKIRADYSFGWAEIGDRRLVTSFTSAVTFTENGKSSGGRSAIRLQDLTIDGKPAADPTAHVNAVTPEARAAIDRWAALCYRSTDHGLRSATATVLPTGVRLDVSSAGLAATAPGAAEDSDAAKIATLLRTVLRPAFFGLPLHESRQYDAEFVERSGRRPLVITDYDGGVVASRKEVLFDEQGRVVSMRSRGPDAKSGGTDFEFGWTQVGDQWQIERLQTWDPTKPARYFFVFSYGEAAGARIPASVREFVSNVGTGGRSPVFALSDVVVNGARVDLPKPRFHENVVTPEAAALIDAFSRVVRPAALRGLTTASGVLVPEGNAPPVRVAFTYCAPGIIAATPQAKSGVADAAAVAASAKFALIVGFVGLRASESMEYDARIVDAAGRRALEVVEYGQGERTAVSETIFGDDGLPTRMRRREGADPAKPTSEFELGLTWERAGDCFRERSCELLTGAPDHPVRNVYALTYAAVGEIDVPVGFARTLPDGRTLAWRVEDLVVNGKKAERPK